MSSDLPALALSDSLLTAAGPRSLRREMTPHEAQHGDIMRLRDDFDRSELAVVTAAQPVVAKIVARLVDEARPHIASGDLAGIADLQPSYVPELASAMLAAAGCGGVTWCSPTSGLGPRAITRTKR